MRWITLIRSETRLHERERTQKPLPRDASATFGSKVGECPDETRGDKLFDLRVSSGLLRMGMKGKGGRVRVCVATAIPALM
jgi:hypothetical protein